MNRDGSSLHVMIRFFVVVTDVIARGTVMIAANMYGVDASLYPLGFPEAAELDQAFANEEATMVITAVGRDGPPVAAKRMKLKGLQFPLSFELTSSDLSTMSLSSCSTSK